jgi:PHD/YefM family antitoxin component YafN of YafNO toxin-antitoxin module
MDDPDDLMALADTLDLLSTPGAVRELNEARDDYRRGDYIDADELRARFLDR